MKFRDSIRDRLAPFAPLLFHRQTHLSDTFSSYNLPANKVLSRDANTSKRPRSEVTGGAPPRLTLVLHLARLSLYRIMTKTHTYNIIIPLLDFCIAILTMNAAEVSPGKEVFRVASVILTLVRDTMIDDKYVVQVSEYCFNACETLSRMIQGRNLDDLSGPERIAMEDMERAMHNIELSLRKEGAYTPHARYDKEMVEDHVQDIRRILNTFHASSSSLREGSGTDERAPHLSFVDSCYSAASSVSESAYGRLISRAFALRELPSLTEPILSSTGESGGIHCLSMGDAQTLIDAMDETLRAPDLSPVARKTCLRLLYRSCGDRALLPSDLNILVHYDQTSSALYRGGYADVWKGEYAGRDVAVKVIRTYSNDELRKVINKFCKEVVLWRFLRHPNVLPLIGVSMSENRFTMVSEWITNGNVNQYLEAHPEADVLKPLAGVAKGLIYLHSNGMIHGDLKGANILIDRTGNALLADFGFLTIVSDPANLLSSSSSTQTQGGTVRWMSPELIAPDQFGFEKSRPTGASDCYALGMVIYEVISGKLPFHNDTNIAVFFKVVKGERPLRESKFTDRLWGMLEQCWASHPYDRPAIEDVLRCLETGSNLQESSTQGDVSFEESIHNTFVANIQSLVYSYSQLSL